jgi:hypothetical protein
MDGFAYALIDLNVELVLGSASRLFDGSGELRFDDEREGEAELVRGWLI